MKKQNRFLLRGSIAFIFLAVLVLVNGCVESSTRNRHEPRYKSNSLKTKTPFIYYIGIVGLTI